ncbi:MAG: gluconate 2-dehydrogenase subunit 3 family protein [Balneolaceae bacterium]|nr:gluconate 2-dehydrogenase subunit 3 family protein [Balneolaceae bacterium]MBO6545656.1 gluconate 2-dehydrogenase subunit 3 family protein [Balneolaceae bacterium]MBO6647052.1 gluconate 2-dehydrogenase subunit 3 family protein [Balneolaceae bacterium]
MSDQVQNLMDRKEALKRVAYLMGGAISAPTILGVMSGCTASQAKPTNFSPEEIKFLGQVADIIIPPTDTPGAKEAGVPTFMDDMIFTIWDEEDRDYFLVTMTDFMDKADRELGKPFLEATNQEQKDFIYKEHEIVFGGDVDWEAPRPFIWQMKEMTFTGYFTSEIGMTQVLQYQMVPGYFDGCITFEEAGGKVWAA